MDNRRSPRGLEGVMQGEAPGNPARPQSLAQGRISCPFLGCSGAFSHDAERRMQDRSKALSRTGHSFMDKELFGMWRHIVGQGHFSYFFPANSSTSGFAKDCGRNHQNPLPRLPAGPWKCP